jgi:hypothetical protein
MRTDSTGPLAAPFRIAGYAWEHVDVLLVSLEKDRHVGQGEAGGVYYRNDTPASMRRSRPRPPFIIAKSATYESANFVAAFWSRNRTPVPVLIASAFDFSR